MSLRLFIRVEAENLEGVQTALLFHGHKAHVALRRAINKTGGWARSHGSRAIAQENGLPLSVLRGKRDASGKRQGARVALYPASGEDLSALVWFGLAPIKASKLGTLRQTPLGAKVGSRLFEGAFVAGVHAGVGSAFRRLGENVPSGLGGRIHTGIFMRRGSSRLPIDEQYVYLSASTNALRRIAAQVPIRMRTVFRQELNYELNVRGRT